MHRYVARHGFRLRGRCSERQRVVVLGAPVVLRFRTSDVRESEVVTEPAAVASETSEARPWGEGLLRVTGGLVLAIGGPLTSGLVGVGAAGPMLGLAGLVVVGTGIHKLLWLPSRATPEPWVRVLVTVVVTAGTSMLASAMVGAVLGLLHRR